MPPVMSPLSSQSNPVDAIPSCDHLERREEHLQLLARALATLGAGRLLGQEVWKEQSQRMQEMKKCQWRWLTLVDVWQDTTLCDGDVSEKLVQLLVVADGELEMTGDDAGLLVVTRGVASQLEDLGRQVLKDSCEVDGRT